MPYSQRCDNCRKTYRDMEIERICRLLPTHSQVYSQLLPTLPISSELSSQLLPILHLAVKTPCSYCSGSNSPALQGRRSLSSARFSKNSWIWHQGGFSLESLGCWPAHPRTWVEAQLWGSYRVLVKLRLVVWKKQKQEGAGATLPGRGLDPLSYIERILPNLLSCLLYSPGSRFCGP